MYSFSVFHSCINFLGLCNKVPQIRQLKAITIYSLTVLGDRDPKSRCQYASSETWVESFSASSWLFMVAVHSCRYLAYSCMSHFLPLLAHGILSVCLCLYLQFPFHTGCQPYWIRAHSNGLIST